MEKGNLFTTGEPVVTLVGRRTFHAENFGRILEVSPCRILILSGHMRIAVCGEGLQLEYYAKEELQVKGEIERVEFC